MQSHKILHMMPTTVQMPIRIINFHFTDEETEAPRELKHIQYLFCADPMFCVDFMISFHSHNHPILHSPSIYLIHSSNKDFLKTSADISREPNRQSRKSVPVFMELELGLFPPIVQLRSLAWRKVKSLVQGQEVSGPDRPSECQTSGWELRRHGPPRTPFNITLLLWGVGR